jgi:hypothetical protein
MTHNTLRSPLNILHIAVSHGEDLPGQIQPIPPKCVTDGEQMNGYPRLLWHISLL